MDLLKDLNPEQKEAVTATEGPLLIIAGAGTGKTRVIAHRVAYILRAKRDVTEENILALTFTNKAADEMKARIAALSGKEVERMQVSTFHSLCSTILGENAFQVNLPAEFRLLDDPDRWIVLRKLCAECELRYFTSPRVMGDIVKALAKFISRAKDEIVLPEDFRNYLDGEKQNLKRRRSQMSADDYEAEMEKLTMYADACTIYSKYQQVMLEAGALDFGDLIIYAIKLLSEKKSALKEYRDRFRYILVDEFQDVNVAQIELLRLLAGENPNLCVVGDDDQSIYRFRGASYASFVKFTEIYPHARIIKLNRNYRSTKRILRVSNVLIENNNPDRFDPGKNLRTERGDGRKVKILFSESEEEQAASVAEEIRKICEQDVPAGRSFSDFAVLYRAHAHRRKIIEALEAQGIPYDVIAGTKLFERDEIKEVIAYLNVIADPEGSPHLYFLLGRRPWRLDVVDLVTISKGAHDNDVSLFKVLENISDLEGVSEQGRSRAKDFYAFLKEHIELASARNVDEVLRSVLKRTRVFADLALQKTPESEAVALNVGRFVQFIDDFIEKSDERDLRSFVDYLKLYIEAKGDPGAVDSFRLEERPDAVRLITVHGAKGLEFPYVFVINAVSQRFPVRRRKDTIAFPEKLMKERLPSGDFHMEEERRLFYVAMTRAKELLYLSTIQKPRVKPSVFIDEAMEAKDDIECLHADASLKRIEKTGVYPSEIELRMLEKRTSIEDEISLLGEKNLSDSEAFNSFKRIADNLKDFIIAKAQRDGEDPWGAFQKAAAGIEKALEESFGKISKDEISRLKRLMQRPPERMPLSIQEKLTLSYSQVDTYKSCPLRYKYRYVFYIPETKSAIARFGLNVHEVLEEFFRALQQGAEPDWKIIEEAYNRKWKSSRFVDKVLENKFREEGLRQLKEFYKKNEKQLKAPLYVEEPFEVDLGPHKVVGKIDRVDDLGGGDVEVIDFKTGSPKDKKFVQKSLQLSIYALAVPKAFNSRPRVLSLYFLESNEKVSTSRSEEELKATEREILEIAEKIQSYSFEPTPGWICQFCDYAWLCPCPDERYARPI